jgi:hypothetical protein
MDANASGWIAAYLEWADADACAIEAPEAAGQNPDTDACSCAETAAAYMEWMTAAAFGRRTGDRAGRATRAGGADGLQDFREAMLLKALQTETDLLHLLSSLAVLERGEPASPQDGRSVADDWPQALDSVAGDVHALAAKVLALQLH